jgi:hypothetical protein
MKLDRTLSRLSLEIGGDAAKSEAVFALWDVSHGIGRCVEEVKGLL